MFRGVLTLTQGLHDKYEEDEVREYHLQFVKARYHLWFKIARFAGKCLRDSPLGETLARRVEGAAKLLCRTRLSDYLCRLEI